MDCSERREDNDKMHKESDDENMDSESDHDEVEMDDDHQAIISELKQLVDKDVYVYDHHIKLINACKEAGEFDQLRDARKKMQELFPLTEDIWLSWLRDEIKFCDSTNKDERDSICEIFEKAVKDYLSVPVWLEYIQFSIGGIDFDDGVTYVREICERALTHGGLHVSKGSSLWEAYREFENVLLVRLMPADGVIDEKSVDDKMEAQNKRIVSLFKRQLTVPLNNMKNTLTEYKEWVGSDVDKYMLQTYQKTINKLTSIQKFEDELSIESTDDPGHLSTYMEYLNHEISVADPARIQCLFERAISDNCLKPEIWEKYTKYLDNKLKIRDIILSVYGRSARNCSWVTSLWLGYIQALERYTQPHTSIKGVFKQALSASVSSPHDSLTLWTLYCDYCRRRIDWSKEHREEIEDFRETIETAINTIFEAFGLEGDPTCSLQRFHAVIEASRCHNMEKAREIWRQVMSSGHGNNAHLWLEYYHIERSFGNSKHCRKLLQQAVNSVRDDAEQIVEAYLMFEKCEGTLEQFEEAKSRCEAQTALISQRRQAAAEKETKATETKKSHKQKSRSEKPSKSPANTKSHENKSHKKRSRTTDDAQPSNEIFKMPLPVLDNTNSSQQLNKTKQVDADQSSSPSKKQKTLTPPNVGDSGKHKRTVFVSNLPYTIYEDALAGIFAKCGELSDVRLVKTMAGTSKGFAYVEFVTQESYEKALRMDRESVEGRPMYVSVFKEKQQPVQFKYATNLEKTKLFISGLPYTCTKEALETLFSQHGTVKDVRLVTYKSGAPKGLAYVEYADEASASQAVLKTDGLLIGEQKISVAISNPPTRKQPVASREANVPTLGSGKTETEQRGKARTQLSMMPRAVSRPKPQTKPTSHLSRSSGAGDNVEPKASQADESETKKVTLSNEQFRQMFMKK